MLLQTSSPPGPDTRPPGGNAPPPRRRFYVPVRAKFASATLLGIAWCALSVWLSQAWLHDLGELIGAAPALFVIAFIAYVPGFMNAFMAGSILLDRRPRRRRLADYPGVTVLVACYNEAANIGDTLTSLFAQDYPGPLEVLVLDDGSTDDSAAIAERAIAAATVAERHRFRVVRGERNVGKAGVLNRGLAMASHELIVTIDGDSWAFRDALTHIVERYHNDPPDTRAAAARLGPERAVAGALRAQHHAGRVRLLLAALVRGSVADAADPALARRLGLSGRGRLGPPTGFRFRRAPFAAGRVPRAEPAPRPRLVPPRRLHLQRHADGGRRPVRLPPAHPAGAADVLSRRGQTGFDRAAYGRAASAVAIARRRGWRRGTRS